MTQSQSAAPIAAGAARARMRAEVVAMFALSWPIVFTNVAVNFMNTTNVMMLGWRSPDALAAGALGFNLYIPFLLFGIGVVGAAAPIAASLIGADPEDRQGVRRVGHQAFLLCLALAIPIWTILWNAVTILRAIGETPDLADAAGRYMHGLQWAFLPDLLYFSMRSLFAALNRTAPILIASLIAVAFNALANYALIFGHFGAPEWGVFGSGIASSLSQSLMLLVMVGYSVVDPHLKPYRLFVSLWRPHAQTLARIWRLGLPIGATIAAEISVFAVSALAMGLIGAESLEAHAIVLQIAATAFMVPLGLGQAATVRVGHAFGARDASAVSLAGWTAFFMTMAFVAVSAATMFAAPRLLISAFISTDAPTNAATLALALSFLRVAAFFQFVDGGQAVLANMLRGVHDSRWPLAMALTGYWAIGAPVGFALAFFTPLHGLGLWIGLAIGLASVAFLLLARWRGKERRGFF
jgi:MATE family multidrug resistance protein